MLFVHLETGSNAWRCDILLAKCCPKKINEKLQKKERKILDKKFYKYMY